MLTNGLAQSRQEAQQFIRAGQVRDLVGKTFDKPGQLVSEDLELIVKHSKRFVSRGGEKLISALNRFPINVSERICLDAGISTGGFTDCLLQNGASLIYGIDVGYGQIAWSLRTNPKVILKERTNLRYLRPENLFGDKDPRPNFAVADVSFISLKLVLPAINELLNNDENNKEALLLVKPQFEVGRNRVGKGGVVREPNDHVMALQSVIDFCCEQGWTPRGLIASPITGPAGNHEYFLWLKTTGTTQIPDLKELVFETLT